MNILDIILLLCLVPAVINGLRKGFIAQVVAIVAIILGGWIAFNFSDAISGWLGKWIAGPAEIMQVIAFIIIFVAVTIGLALLGKLLEATIKIILLGWLNRLLGLLFAVFKYVLVIGLLVVVFEVVNNKFEFVAKATLEASVMYSGIKATAFAIFPYLKQLFF